MKFLQLIKYLQFMLIGLNTVNILLYLFLQRNAFWSIDITATLMLITVMSLFLVFGWGWLVFDQNIFEGRLRLIGIGYWISAFLIAISRLNSILSTVIPLICLVLIYYFSKGLQDNTLKTRLMGFAVVATSFLLTGRLNVVFNLQYMIYEGARGSDDHHCSCFTG